MLSRPAASDSKAAAWCVQGETRAKYSICTAEPPYSLESQNSHRVFYLDTLCTKSWIWKQNLWTKGPGAVRLRQTRIPGGTVQSRPIVIAATY